MVAPVSAIASPVFILSWFESISGTSEFHACNAIACGVITPSRFLSENGLVVLVLVELMWTWLTHWLVRD